MVIRDKRLNQTVRNDVLGYIRRTQNTGLIRIPGYATLLEFYQQDPNDNEIREILEEDLEKAEFNNLINPDPFTATNPVSPHDLPGNIAIGLIPPLNIPYLISPELLKTHALVVGRTGGGKTWLNFLISIQLLRLGYKVTIFDRKFEYHVLLRFPDFIYLLFEDYYANWIEPPPGVDLRSHVNTLCEIIGNFLDIRAAARALLASKILWLCKKWDSENSGIYPTFKDVYNLIKNTKYPLMSHTARYKETILNRLEGLFTVFGDHICSHRKRNRNRIYNTSLAISLDGIPTDYQNLFIAVTVSESMDYRISNNLRSADLKELILIDEGGTVFKKWHEYKESTYLLTDYLARSRDYGVGFLISSQNLSHMAESVLINAGMKLLVGGVGYGPDNEIFAAATGMDNEKKEYIKRRKQAGQACASDLRFPYPFTLDVFNVFE